MDTYQFFITNEMVDNTVLQTRPGDESGPGMKTIRQIFVASGNQWMGWKSEHSSVSAF